MASDEGDARSAATLLRSIADETATLVRKETQLARQELNETLNAWLAATVAVGAAAALALVTLVFLGLAAESALARVIPEWLARAIVGLVALAAATAAGGFARSRARGVSLMPEDTRRTVKEDVEWAKAQLRR